jgi:hypothetical protein
MRATDFIRDLLDIIDRIDCQLTDDVIDVEVDVVQDVEELPFSNTPDEMYADIGKVTVDAGGGVNGPKHPADIRADSVAMYPHLAYRGKS